MRKFLLFAIISLSIHLHSYCQATWFVKADAAGANNGTSWANAFTSLQSAIDAAQPNDQVWVAAGVYYPEKSLHATSPDPRYRSFVLTSGVRFYGGFAGNEPLGTDLSLRNFETNQTILSGDLDQNDVTSNGISTSLEGNNSFHVVVAVNAQPATTFDGFTVTGGNGVRADYVDVGAAQIHNASGSGLYFWKCNFTPANLLVEGNYCFHIGGGMFIANATMSFINLRVRNNACTSGAGIAAGSSNVVFHHLLLENNNAGQEGGGWYSESGQEKFFNSVVRQNRAQYGGGGYSALSTVEMINCLIEDNESVITGGGWFTAYMPAGFINTTVSRNRSAANGGLELSDGSILRNCIVYGNEAPANPELIGSPANFRNSIVGNDFYDNAGAKILNYVNGPVFREAASGDYSLAFGSSAVNAGDNQFYLQSDDDAPATDLAGATRIHAGMIDLGAFECNVQPDQDGILYVNANASTQTEIGNSWTNSLKDLADALGFANRIQNSAPGYIREIWVTAGTYRPKYKPAAKNINNVPTTERDKTLLLARTVALYGGFAGTPGSEGNRDVRDWNNNATILDGDIDLDGTFANNVYHVVLVVGGSSNTILDGFVIQNGNADESIQTLPVPVDGFHFIYPSNGGGLYIGDGSPTIRNLLITGNRAVQGGGACSIHAEPQLNGIIFEGNFASLHGGGMHNQLDAPQVANCSFVNNVAQEHGGGWYNVSGNTIISSSTFTGNQAVDGAGWYNYSGEAEMDSLLFSQNIAVSTGPVSGDGFGAGIYIRTTRITVTNTRFLQNTARRGAGIYNNQSNSAFYNLLFAGNEGAMSAGGIENREGSPVLVNCLFSGNRGAYGAGINNSFGNPVLVHGTFYGNAADWGGGINNNSGTFTVKNSVVRGNFANLGGAQVNGSVLYYFSLIDDMYYLQNNGIYESVPLDDAELFINPRPAVEAPTIEGNYRLKTNAWIINHGDPEVFLSIHNPDISHIQFDLAGSPRIISATDLGAYEFDAAALPVRLLHFRAEWQGQQVQLAWATAMEQQNDRFEIEHSTDGVIFSLIHTEKGAGDANTPRHYVTNHRNPPAGLNYYRLKQFDLDGHMYIMGVRLVNVQSAIANTARLYPNPAPGFFQLALPPISGKLNLQLINAKGAVVHREALQINGGPSVITVNPPKKLASGWYSLRLTGEKINATISVLIK